MAFRNPILKFASDNPIIAVIAVPMLMHLGGRAIAMGVRTARFDRPLAAVMPTVASDDELRNLGYTGGGTPPADMIQKPSHTPKIRYDGKAMSPAFMDDPNYKARQPNWSVLKNSNTPPVYNPENVMSFSNSRDAGIPIGLAGSNHSVFNGLSGVHKLNY